MLRPTTYPVCVLLHIVKSQSQYTEYPGARGLGLLERKDEISAAGRIGTITIT